MLLQFMRQRFGDIPKQLEQQISHMDGKALLAISKKVFNAKRIDEITDN